MKMMTYEEFGAGCTKEYLVGQGGIPGTIMTVVKMMVVEGMVVEMMVMTMMMVLVVVERDAW